MVNEKELKHDSRRKSIKEGIFAAAKGSFGDRFLHPFAIAINTSSSLVALMTSLAGILGPLSQTLSSNIFENKSRKKVVLSGVFIESLMWLPLIAIAILFSKGLYLGILPTFFIILFSIYTIVGNSIVPAWFSWMGDIVDKKYRGRWFSKRTLITSFVTVVLATISSFFLDYMNKKDLAMIGFSVLFGLALISRFAAWKTFKKQYEPKLKVNKKDHFSFMTFLKNAPKNNFGRFAIFRSFFVFAGAIFSSLLAVYLLRYLKLNYTIYMIILLSELVFTIAVMNIWGKFADKYGNYRIMAISMTLIPVLPILWILFPNPLYLIFVPSLLTGIVWGGFRLADSNFIYDNISKEKRSLAVSYYNLMLGAGIFLGAMTAAWLIKFETILKIESIFFIFLLSSAIRMLVIWFGFPKIKEVRKTSQLSKKSFGKDIFRQIKPSILEEIHEIASIKNYLKD